MYGSPPAPRVTPIFLPLSLARSPTGTPASARAITESTSLCGLLSALFQVWPISTTGTPRDDRRQERIRAEQADVDGAARERVGDLDAARHHVDLDVEAELGEQAALHRGEERRVLRRRRDGDVQLLGRPGAGSAAATSATAATQQSSAQDGAIHRVLLRRRMVGYE